MKKTVMFFLSTLCITGCTPEDKALYNQGNPSIRHIHETLQKDVQIDRAIAARQRYAPRNLAFNQALLNQSRLHLSRQSFGSFDKRFDIAVNNAPAKSFFTGLVVGTPYNMIVSPEVQGTVSLKLKNVTLEETLQAVQDIYGYSFEKTSYGFEILPPQLQTKVFNLNYLDVERDGYSNVYLSSTSLSTDLGNVNTGNGSNNSSSGSNNRSGSSSNDSGAKVTTLSNHKFWLRLENTLTALIGTEQGRSVTVNPHAGIIIVRGYPADLRTVADYLDKTQKSLNRQVILEAKILEVKLNDGYQAGIDWQKLRFGQNGSVLSTPITDGGNFFSLTLGASPINDGSLTNFGAVISLLELQGNVQTLSSPRIATINNQQAVIKVGTDDFFVTSITSNVTPSNGTNTNSSSVGLTPFFSGITLDVTPEISAQDDIVLHVHPSVSQVVDKTKEVDLGQSGGKLTLPLAESTVRESDSIVRAKNGQIVVIGGLMQNNTTENLASTPGLTRIPFLGHLFRHTQQSSTKSELVILLRPVVVKDDTWVSRLQQERNRFCQLDRGFHLGSRPEIFGTRGETENQP